MYLGFFIISALDLLDAWRTVASEQERSDYVNWIYHCQHPDGGFRMWPGTDFGELRNASNAKWDPANIPATYFALAALLATGDDLSRVKRGKTLEWIRKMQREDGSFGETLVEGKVEGGMDPRFGYCATGIRHILRGDSEGPLIIDGVTIDDIKIDALVRCITLAEVWNTRLKKVQFANPFTVIRWRHSRSAFPRAACWLRVLCAWCAQLCQASTDSFRSTKHSVEALRAN